MESATFARAQVGPLRDVSAADSERLVNVFAIYELSEEGRKASLIAGGDGRAVQRATLSVPSNQFHLVTVDPDGTARLKLRPRFHLDRQQQVVRVDAAPVYDVLPSVDELLSEAARNHQLERVYRSERDVRRSKKRESTRELRNRLAEQFLNNSSQRALIHPVPTPTSCYLVGPEGRIRFDAEGDEGIACQVPSEAHRRFRADLRARTEQRRQAHLTQLAIHEEKKRVAADWIAQHGSVEQQGRLAAGVLPIAEVVELMTTEMFRVLDRWSIYPLDGADRLQAHLRQHTAYATATVSLRDLAITVNDAHTATKAQWALVQALQTELPDASVTLRAHHLAWKNDPHAPSLTVFGARVKFRCGPFTLVREYAAPDA